MLTDPEIIIVGAGPTGLTTGCLLLRQGVPCRVIDDGDGPTDLSRALGVSSRSLEILDEFGAADEAYDRGIPLRSAVFYSRGRVIGRVTSGSVSGTRFPYMLTLPQYDTERVLLRRFTELGGTVDHGVELRALTQGDDGVRLLLDHADGTEETARAHWVVGADGAHSVVRKAAGVDFPGRQTRNVFAIVDAEVRDAPDREVGHYYYAPEGLLVGIPLPDGRYRFAATIASAAEHTDLSMAYIQSIIDARVPSPPKLVELSDAGWGIGQVRVHTRIAATFRAGRCLLGGDAAHIYSPVGGQGMNGGIQDAHNLAWKLGLVATGRAPESLLDSYDAERRPTARSAMRDSNTQTKLATVRSRPLIAVRDAVLTRASRSGALERRVAPSLTQLTVAYPAGPALAGNSAPVGVRVPDVRLEHRDGTATLHGLLRAAPFTVLALAGSETGALAALRAMAGRYDGTVAVRRVAPGPAPRAAAGTAGTAGTEDEEAGAVAYDADDALRVFLGGADLCVVRPDAYAGYVGAIAEPAGLFTYLARVLAEHGGVGGAARGAAGHEAMETEPGRGPGAA